MSDWRPTGENESVVVQCPTCQSKFRIADDKVTDRGVRVRCTSCKNVFQVRKPGSSGETPMPGPGNTVQLSALEAQQLTRSGPRSAVAPPPPARPVASRPPPAATASRPPPRGSNGTARRLNADDLFGMAELTGDAPLSESSLSQPPPPPPPRSSPAVAKPMPNFDDIDIEVPDEAAPHTAKPPPPPPKVVSRPPPPPPPSVPPPSPPAAPSQEEDTAVSPPPAADSAVLAGSFSSAMHDPFEGMDMGEPGTGALELSTQPKRDKLAEAVKAEQAEQAAKPLPATPKPPEPEIPPAKAMVSSALTGMVGAALAIAVVIVSAVSDDAAAGWLGLTPGSEVVATRVVSGLYDTAAGKPVFFVRGKVENRGARVRGPVRVTAELLTGDGPEVKAETIAGTEPTPEDVWSLKSQADVDKLNRSLEMAQVQRKLQPGTSLPFFAVIPDPPADLSRHRLHVKVESMDAWNPPAPPAPPKAAKGK